MTLTLYNTLTRRKEPFRPIDPSNVRMYVCGPTVYDYAHIGNARPVIVFDVLFRLLRHIYGAGHVTYARNITDVDDKINARAAEEYPDLPLNEAIRKVTETTERQFHEDISALGVLTPTVEPRATEHIAEMRQLCEALVAKGHAYVADDHVLFDVATMPDYGRLANRSLEEMEAGARVDVAPYKKGPMDFVLWKPSKPGEPAWPSPMGIKAPGRPGWHIECSAMADRWLWQEPQMRGLLSEAGLKQPHVFDIHGGGIDLVFPHHENEIAQSRCAHGTPGMANVWMHNGFLQVEGEKMSKSLGNFVTINELLRSWKGHPWPGSAVRWAMMQTHYRQPMDWTPDLLRTSAVEIEEYLNVMRGSFRDAQTGKVDFPTLKARLDQVGPSPEVIKALSDDLNTPEAIAAVRTRKSGREIEKLLASVADLLFLGVLKESDLKYYSLFHGVATDVPDKEEAMKLARTYQIARANNDIAFAASALSEFSKRGLLLEEREPSLLIVKTASEGVAFDEYVQSRVGSRNAARKAKNFKEADRIRDELTAMGIQLKDAKNPTTGEIETTWEVKR